MPKLEGAECFHGGDDTGTRNGGYGYGQQSDLDESHKTSSVAHDYMPYFDAVSELAASFRSC